MAKYTEVLHDLLMNEEVNELINKALSTYPLYQAAHQEVYVYIPTRDELNKKILNHYRFYEIGSETVGRFLYNLEMTMNEIMPKYNQLYKSIDVMNGVDDIFGNLDVVESFEEETTGNSTSSSSNVVTSTNNTETDTSTSGRNVGTKTPQSQLQTKTIDNITSASEMSWNESSDHSSSNSSDESNATNESEGQSTGKTTHTLSRKGNQGVNTYAHDMLEFRQLILNVEQQIINDPELASCFMLIW